MHNRTFPIVFIILGVSALLLACRTTDLIASLSAPTTPTRERITRASLRPTFTPIPSDTPVPPPTETPVPADTEVPTDVPPPTDTDVPPTRVPPTRAPAPTATPQPTPTPNPTATLVPDFPWYVSSGPTCTVGNEGADRVTGTVMAHDRAAPGWGIQASSGPGGDPISDQPAESDSNGDYKVVFICNGTACNGDFWMWLIDKNNQQVSPFVKFHFSSTCRVGTLDFTKK